jgi:hypothetical protein
MCRASGSNSSRLAPHRALIDKAAKNRETRAAAEKLHADAEKGDPKAEYEIGDQYWTGRGVSQDVAEAAKWYRKSADQGFGDAQISLGFAYQSGQGVAQDNVQADTWYIIAAASEKSSAETIAMAIRHRDYIEPNMMPEQIAEARKRAQEWKPTMISVRFLTETVPDTTATRLSVKPGPLWKVENRGATTTPSNSANPDTCGAETREARTIPRSGLGRGGFADRQAAPILFEKHPRSSSSPRL